MDGCMDGWLDGWMGGWMDGWVGGWMDGWMGRLVDGWMDGEDLTHDWPDRWILTSELVRVAMSCDEVR